MSLSTEDLKLLRQCCESHKEILKQRGGTGYWRERGRLIGLISRLHKEISRSQRAATTPKED